MRMYPVRPSAFTLIELLIVVAIIAILAAIAVPNFLEAQTRARVSRTENDLRSIALAAESYYIDNNGYPTSYNRSPLPGSTLSQADRRLLTTPIAYMTEIPIDIFRKVAGGSATLYYILSTAGYPPNAVEGTNLYNTHPRTAFMTFSIGPDVTSNCGGYRTLKKVIRNESLPLPNMGTDPNTGAYIAGTGAADGMRYDPTNGTVSWGDIFRFAGDAISKDF